MSTTTTPKGTTMATRTPTHDGTDTQATLETFADDARTRAIHHYTGGKRLDRIAADDGHDLATVARWLRHAGVLAPWDDPRTLAHLYHDYGHTLASLSEVWPDAPGPEAIRTRMKHYDIERTEPSLADRLADENVGPEDIGLSPTTDDDHTRYTKRGGSA